MLYVEKKLINGKYFYTLYVEFSSGFLIPVKPCFELTKKQFSLYMKNLEDLEDYMCDNDINIPFKFTKEGDK